MKQVLTVCLISMLVVGCTNLHLYEDPESGKTTATPTTAATTPKPPTASATGQKPPFKPMKEVLKDTRAINGYIKTHLKRDNTIFFEIRQNQLDKDFGVVMHFSKGNGVFNLHDGLPVDYTTRLMRFRRAGDTIYLVHRNHRFTADSGSPMAVSLEDNVGHSIVAAFKIEAQDSASKNLVVNATSFFVSDYPQIGEQVKFYFKNRPAQFDKARSFVSHIQNFEKNTEIDVELTYKAGTTPITTSAGISDYRSIPVGIRYSIFALPETPMPYRIADDRVGHFLDAVRDFSRDDEVTPYVRYVNRWRLEKKDNSETLSEPVQPIVFYIDRSVPMEYRPYVKEGIEGWNKAFEAAGFKNAIVAKQAPENDSTWSAEDIRFSTVRWTAAHSMGYAIGPSQTDPRSGEILNADILISSTFVTSWNYEYDHLIAPEAYLNYRNQYEALQQFLPREVASRMCMAQMGKSQQLGFMRAAIGVLDGTEEMPESYLGDAIRDLVLHEVGHTLGLRHNFKGSTAIPYDKLNDTAFTKEHGLSLSVMEYAAVNINPDRQKQGHYVNKEVGSYDKWAIQYAYAPAYKQNASGAFAMTGTPVTTPEEELVGLKKIASQAANPMHTYNTDEDTHLGPMAIDPNSNTWDIGSDVLAFAKDRATIVSNIMPRLEERLIGEGEGYQQLRNAFANVMFERMFSLVPVTKTIGGIHYSRDHKNDPNGRPPFDPVPADEQREALNFIIEQAFSKDAISFDADMLNKLAPNRYSDWATNSWFAPIDYPVHDMVVNMQGMMLMQLVDNGRLRRMVDNTVRVPNGEEAFTVAEFFSTLTGAIWTEIINAERPEAPNSFRRNLQRVYINQMINIMLDKRPTPASIPPPEDARSLARFELMQLSNQVSDALANGTDLDTTARAHLMESKARIDAALEMSLNKVLE